MTMTELFEEWKAKLQPIEQTAHEFEQSLGDFVDQHGDLPVAQVTDNDLLDLSRRWRQAASSMPRSDRLLPFTERVAKYRNGTRPRISPATLKKRVGEIQAFLKFSFDQKWIEQNVGTGFPIDGYSKTTGLKWNNFDEADLVRLFASPCSRSRRRGRATAR